MTPSSQAKNKKQIVKVWSTAKADKFFSEYIRERDGRCVLCGKKDGLTCSHFWGRYASATRYDPENCDALCMGCHFKVENAKQGVYLDFKMKQLGKKRYMALSNRYYQEKTTRRDAILKLMDMLEKVRNNAE